MADKKVSKKSSKGNVSKKVKGRKKTLKKPVAKKKAVAKKKTVVKKKSVAKKKKTVAKKVAVKKIKSKTLAHGHGSKTVTHKRVVFVGACSNCDHVPMRVGKLLVLMSVMIAILSGMVIAQSYPLDTSQSIDQTVVQR